MFNQINISRVREGNSTVVFQDLENEELESDDLENEDLESDRLRKWPREKLGASQARA